MAVVFIVEPSLLERISVFDPPSLTCEGSTGTCNYILAGACDDNICDINDFC